MSTELSRTIDLLVDGGYITRIEFTPDVNIAEELEQHKSSDNQGFVNAMVNAGKARVVGVHNPPAQTERGHQ